jgi:hypothetical protein
MKRVFLLAVIFGLGATAFAETPAEAAFAKLKSLVGTWKGRLMGNDIVVTYTLTGAGSALAETQFPGTDTEMLTVYHMDNGKLVLTHYCSSGNQPSLKFTPAKDARYLNFKFDHGSNMKLSDHHMHELSIFFKNPDEIESVWKGWADGKESHTAKFELKRQAD